MFQIVMTILAYLVKNIALIISILEAIVKVLAGIITLTPTKKDDALIPQIDKVFSAIKKVLYNLSEFMSGE